MSDVSISIEGVSLIDFYGVNNSKLKLLKAAFPTLKITSRGSKIKVAGNENDIDRFNGKVNQLVSFLKDRGKLNETDIETLLDNDAKDMPKYQPDNSEVLVYGRNGRLIKAKTPNQKKLVESSFNNDIVFAVGPAGTGKTYTAVALAVRALKAKEVRKIILTRPAVEAGESLGFLPGDLKEKIDPYLRPLYDALDDMIPAEKLEYLMENRIIEIAPLAFMRGRTLDHAFIILDEAQNCTESQLKMFLTRIGPHAQCMLTGDITQIDLPKNFTSGFKKSVKLLGSINGIGVVTLTTKDVIRHRLVKSIIEAFQKNDERNDK